MGSVGDVRSQLQRWASATCVCCNQLFTGGLGLAVAVTAAVWDGLGPRSKALLPVIVQGRHKSERFAVVVLRQAQSSPANSHPLWQFNLAGGG